MPGLNTRNFLLIASSLKHARERQPSSCACAPHVPHVMCKRARSPSAGATGHHPQHALPATVPVSHMGQPPAVSATHSLPSTRRRAWLVTHAQRRCHERAGERGWQNVAVEVPTLTARNKPVAQVAVGTFSGQRLAWCVRFAGRRHWHSRLDPVAKRGSILTPASPGKISIFRVDNSLHQQCCPDKDVEIRGQKKIEPGFFGFVATCERAYNGTDWCYGQANLLPAAAVSWRRSHLHVLFVVGGVFLALTQQEVVCNVSSSGC